MTLHEAMRLFGGRLKAVRRSIAVAADFVSPRICAACETALKPGREMELCQDCLAQAEYLEPPYCIKCGDGFSVAAEADRERLAGRTCSNCRRAEPAFTLARAAFRYEGRVRRAIQALKFGGRKSLVRTFSAMMQSRISCLSCAAQGVDEMTAVPLGKSRERERGYNQSLLLARSLAPILGLKAPVTLLRKTRTTPPQVGLDREERLLNVRNTFEIEKGAQVEGKVVLLVDDVMTTGATVSECARVLSKAGASEIRVLAAARG